jgi:chorismate mutase
MVYAVRGAIGVEKNDASLFAEAVQKLVSALCRENSVHEEDIVSIVFSQTRDLTSANPAACLRRVGYSETPLFCTQEPEYPDSLPRILRVLLTFRAQSRVSPCPIYLGRAAALRPDLREKINND